MPWKHNIVADDETGREFANHLGYVILNCGNLEQLTYVFAATLMRANLFATGLGSDGFAKRVVKVCALLSQAPISGGAQAHAVDAWDQTKPLMQMRNLVAHNPIAYVGIDKVTDAQESGLAVIDMAESREGNLIYLEAEKLKSLANETQKLAHKLDKILKEIVTELNA